MVSGVCQSVTVCVYLDCRGSTHLLPLRRFEGSEKWAGAQLSEQQFAQNTVGGNLVSEAREYKSVFV